MPSGRRPDLKRRQQMPLVQIGKPLGITRQGVQKALALQGKLRGADPLPRLRERDHAPPHRGQARNATFGQRLNTRRLSAGRCGRRTHAAQQLCLRAAKLIRVLGVDWLAVE
jgi:hypothetical protein